ncbi:carbohydrate ABC transporter permease [Phaeovulum vinaykumarii]|uniref:Maltose ABC transporter membrane protein /trehalose ABC transporter membrane protein /sucrose ABC transporter membrane protein n=1 Tax=Phaeovulum vinaykumarii TaxID=407234 RepID=A0A1N7LJK4_9RHOB|nr:carbohydrate ABC transporter permease [Phaeovulum vinaykumarii]SIS73979.1 maltose ABC transporter membrane protein /trehalose ABC transporter membrane protein /sucrose ABC transporter membrane protein [Phaeovulum vinaykumarii]SOC04840.1 maltose ABC transporter membrane protein /trehalose ABC transporter membrane protein /sucrose ABC transporter membrane protein [Phaeovulum vinaykumarii]
MSALALLRHLAVAALVALWLLPTAGLLVTALRDPGQITGAGWWSAPFPATVTVFRRLAPTTPARADGDAWLHEGQLLGPDETLLAWGLSARDPAALAPGAEIATRAGDLRVAANGRYVLRSPQPEAAPGLRVFLRLRVPPRFTFENFARVIGAEGMGRAFLNSLMVTVPATVLPILVAGFAAYALAFMRFAGRALIVAGVVALLVVPLHLTLIPLLRLHNAIGLGKGFLGVWLAHTGFGLPLAVHLLRNAMLALPREIVDCARLDGASELRIFFRIVLPLSFPALAAFATFQFLWVWNDLLVALVFLGAGPDQQVLTGALREMMGARGGEWGLLAAAAFVAMALPLAVFFGLQRSLVRGLLTGAVKGG